MRFGRPGRHAWYLALLMLGAYDPARAQPEGCWIRDVASYGDEATWVLCENGRIYKTEDGGRTWAILRLGELRARALRLGSPIHAIVAGAEGVLLLSDDGGASWRRPESGVRSHLNSIAVRGEKIWVAGHEGTILHSADNGRSWRLQPSLTRNNLEGIWFLDGQHGWAAGWNGTILRTADGGASWENVSPGNIYQTLTAIWFRTPEEGWVVGIGGLILHTADGGSSWSRLPSPDPGWLRSILFTPDGTGYIAGEKILASYDGGKSWQPLAFDAPEALLAIVLHRGRLWVFGPHTLATSSDGGASWELAANLFEAKSRRGATLPT